LGIVRMVGVSLWLVGNVFGPADEGAIENQNLQPPGAQRTTGKTQQRLVDDSVAALGGEFTERLRRGVEYDFESTAYFRLILRLRERGYDRWRYLRRLAWIPGENDIDAVNLPERFFGLYGLVRAGRLTRKAVTSS
jgi:hypothetical protein